MRKSKFMFSVIACIAIAFSASVSAADNFKQSGTALQGFSVPAQHDHSGSPVAVVVAAPAMHVQARVTIEPERMRIDGALVVAVVHPLPALKQIGTQAETEAEGRSHTQKMIT